MLSFIMKYFIKMCSYLYRNVCANTLQLPELCLDEAVLDFEMPEPIDEEPDNLPGQRRVVSEEDLVGKRANIAFNDNLLTLANHLTLPMKKCSHKDKQSGACPGARPFRVNLKPRGTGVILECVCQCDFLCW